MDLGCISFIAMNLGHLFYIKISYTLSKIMIVQLIDYIIAIIAVGSHYNTIACSTTLTETGLILGLRQANERRRFFVTTSRIGWAQG